MNNEDFEVVLSDKEYIEKLEKEVHYQNKEVTRLNNIINKLEKWCNNGIKNGIHISYEQELDYEDVLDKLKELKENNNE